MKAVLALASLALSILAPTPVVASGDSVYRTNRDIKELYLKARAKHTSHLSARAEPEVAPGIGSAGPSITFANPKAKEFYVDGKSIPEVGWDLGPSWSGLMPISDKANETRKLFFWFFPSNNPKYTEDLVFWTNGGPGCSALEGLSQENGPFSWPPGTAKPIPNQWSWTNLTHVLWVEQPVGTGFSQGVPNITNEDELAAQFAGFLNQFLSVFSELKGKNFYATGESYAGIYVPYIANYLYTHPGLVPLNLKGIWITDPSVSWDIVTEQIPAYNFANKYKEVLALDSKTMSTLKAMSDKCGFTDFYTTYATYPPKGPLPLPKGSYVQGKLGPVVKKECDVFDAVFEAAITANPNFNIYRIFDVWPVLWDVLGFPGSFINTQSELYFNRSDVQAAIHAPPTNWNECSDINVFVNGVDKSEPVFLKVLPNVIEKSERTIVSHGNIDFVLIAEGTRIAIQNMTWGGKQGFQQPIPNENLVVNGFGSIGRYYQERNLTYIEVNLSGHMFPQFAPWAGYIGLEYLLGRGEIAQLSQDPNLYPNDLELYGSAKPSKGGSREEL